MLPTCLTFVDIETTGCSPQRDKIIEIGIIRVENGKVSQIYESLVNPQGYISPEITLLTGITSRQLEHAPTFYSIKETIKQLFDDALFVAHNARFDYTFIKSEFARLEEPFSTRLLCTAKLSRRLFPRFKRHNLDSIIERFNLNCDLRHRALPDAKVLWDFFQILQNKFDGDLIASAISDVTKTASLPPTIPRHVINSLPESAGVYIFYDPQGAPLYIGKSLNVKDRVLSHFYEFAQSNKEATIFQSIGSVEAIPTSGELEALLLESKLVKDYRPIYNRQLRTTSLLIALLQSQNPNGYYTLAQTQLSELKLSDVPKIVGVFRTQRQLKDKLQELAREYELCNKLLGVEKTPDRCFGFHIKQCHGACINKELPAKYNMRFTQAFSKTKVRRWPFRGPIVISEGDRAHAVYYWCYLGTLDDSRAHQFQDISLTATFDYDAYKILAKFLLNPRHQLKIRELTTKAAFNRNSDATMFDIP